jgi:membrane-bound serine protease (ClpP class)
MTLFGVRRYLAILIAGCLPVALAAQQSVAAHPTFLPNPNAAVLLLALGGFLILIEFNAPGAVLPGAVGVFCVLLALFELQKMHMRPGAAVLLVMALILFLAEAKFPTRGLIALAGIAAMVASLAHLIATDDPRQQVSRSVAVGAGLGFGAITCALAVLGERARREKVKIGKDAMLGCIAVAQTSLEPLGQVMVRGEIWSAHLTAPATRVAVGETVRIVASEGLLLSVVPAPDAVPTE